MFFSNRYSWRQCESEGKAGVSSSMDSKPRALPLTNFNSVPSGHGSCPLFLRQSNLPLTYHLWRKKTHPVYMGSTLISGPNMLELRIRQEKYHWVFNSSARKMSKDAAFRAASVTLRLFKLVLFLDHQMFYKKTTLSLQPQCYQADMPWICALGKI